MKYFIILTSLLILSGASGSRVDNNTQTKKEESPQSYLSIEAYQQDYSELQQKSVKVNSKVKNILNQVKSYD